MNNILLNFIILVFIIISIFIIVYFVKVIFNIINIYFPTFTIVNTDCKYRRFGCCNDKLTPKLDFQGSNCTL